MFMFTDEKKELNELLESLLEEECDVSSRGRNRKMKKLDSDSDELSQLIVYGTWWQLNNSCSFCFNTCYNQALGLYTSDV